MSRHQQNTEARNKWMTQPIYRIRGEHWSNYDELWEMALSNAEVTDQEILTYLCRTSIYINR